MADGSVQAIENVREGQTVACVDAGGPTSCTVGETTHRRVSTVLDLAVETDTGEVATITVTPEHPFYVAEFERWLDADDLEPGYTLALLDGSAAQVLGHERRTGEFEVYNFESQGAHDYFVGEVFVLVHNACSGKLARAIEVATGVMRPANHAAHHIVAVRAKLAQPSREILERVGVKIDDAANGVYLPQNWFGRTANPTAAYHPKLHTNTYYKSVYSRLSTVETKAEAETVLRKIGEELAAGTFVY